MPRCACLAETVTQASAAPSMFIVVDSLSTLEINFDQWFGG